MMMKQVWLSAYLLAAASALQAVPVTWYLSQVTFSDGGRAVGSFVYDADIQALGAINVQTTPGATTTNASSAIAGGSYTFRTTPSAPPQPGAPPAAPPALVFLSPAGAQTRILNLLNPNILTNAGGTVQLRAGALEGFCNATCSGVLAGAPSRSITGGFITATPASAPVTWYLTATFDDGGQAVGSFDFDATTGSYLNVDIATTPGAAIPNAARLRFSRAGLGPTVAVFQTDQNVIPGTSRVMIFTPAGPLGNRAFVPSVGSTTSLPIVFPISLSEGNCPAGGGASCPIGSGLRNQVSGTITNARPANFTRVISQVADGGGWITSVVLTNLTDSPAPYSLTFAQDDGTPFAVGGIGAFSAGTIPARGVAFLTSNNPATLTQGWGLLTGGQNISLTTTFTSKAANAGGDQEASVPGDNAGSTSLAVPFDNTNGLVSGFALTNTTNNPVTVLAVGYDSTGRILMTDSALTLPAFGHTAFVLRDRPGYQLLNNQRGLLRIFTINGGQPPYTGVNGLLLKFLPNGAFSTVGVTTQ